MPSFDKQLTVRELIEQLSRLHPGSQVRVAYGNGRGWPHYSTPIQAVYDHVGGPDEGAYVCLEVDEAWATNDCIGT